METLLSRVESTLQKYDMLISGEPILVACSGGPDSVALFHLLEALAPRWKLRLSLIHFDHALRANSSADFKFVQRLARQSRIPFYGARAQPPSRVLEKGLSPEEIARKKRYDFFKRVAQKTRVRKVALGHHRDDQAETVLMRILQGTGPRGLQGIRPVTEFNPVTLIRPLIEVERNEIRKFLRQHSIAFREDPTNQSTRFLRNRIRRRLLPFLEKEFNPQIREALCRLAEATSAESSNLDDWVKRHGKEYLRCQRNGALWLDRDRFFSLPGALQFRLLDQMLRVLHPKSGLDFESWKRIEQGIRKGSYRATFPRGLDLNLTPKKFFVKKIR